MPEKLIPPEVPLADWARLHEVALEFRRAEPWVHMEDRLVCCVIDAAGTPWFAVILGAAKEIFGLTLYRGEAGLSLVSELQAGAGTALVLEYMDGLTLWLSGKTELDSFEKKRYAALKYSPPRGTKRAWPQYLSYRAGFAPWHLEPQEVQVMLTALRFLTPFAIALRGNPALWSGKFSDNGLEHEIPVFDSRTGTPNGIPGEWRRWKIEPLKTPVKRIRVSPGSEDFFAKIRKFPISSSIAMEVDVAPMGIVSEPPRPYHARALFVGESKSKTILYYGVLKRDEPATLHFTNRLLELVEKNKSRPKVIRVRDDVFAEGIEGILEAMDIPLEITDELPGLDGMLLQMMQRGGF